MDKAFLHTAVVIPARNEASRIAPVIAGARSCAEYVIVVDDGSSDETSKVAQEAGAIVLRHRINLGKGSALRTGCRAARMLGVTYIVCMDGDGQHRPEDITKLLEPLTKGEAEIVFTARAMSIEDSMPLILNLGNRFLSGIARLLFGIRLRDTQCGFRAMTFSAFEKVLWISSDYAVETEMIVRAGKARLKYGEVEIPTIYLDRHKGTNALDGVSIFLRMILWRIFPWAFTPQ